MTQFKHYAIHNLQFKVLTFNSTDIFVVRSFLDEVPTDIMHLHSQKIDTYKVIKRRQTLPKARTSFPKKTSLKLISSRLALCTTVPHPPINYLPNSQSNYLSIYLLQGNYSDFNNTMVEKLKAQQREYESQMEYRKHVQEFIDKFRYRV